MSILDAVILGVVQGITEFLPISSSGHLVVVQKLLGVHSHDLIFDMAAHLGTLGSIFTLYYVVLKNLSKSLTVPRSVITSSTPEGHLIKMVFIGSIPTAIIGLGFKDQFEAMFNDMTSLGVCFILTGIILLLTQIRGNTKMNQEALRSLDGVYDIKWWMALLIGIAQGAAIAPSISRSGITIVAGILIGLRGSTAALYSFMLSIPAVGGAALLELRHANADDARIGILMTGFLAAYFAGVLGLWGTLKSVKSGRLNVFTGYLVILGIAILYYWA